MSGTVFGVGVGPGDPDLITLRAARLISASRVIAYPVQRGNSLARSIAASLVPPEAVEIAIDTPMGEKGVAQAGYEQAVRDMVPHLEAGRDVVVLCEGDPLFYGSFMYLMSLLEGRYPVEVVPGVSSLTACASAAHIPLIARNDRLVVLSAPSDDALLQAGIETAETAVIFKVGKHLPRVRQLLERMSLLDKTLYVERATQTGQRILPLAQIEDMSGAYFAVLIVRRG